MRAKTIKCNSPTEIRLALHQGMSDSQPGNAVGRGFKPTVGIIFISIRQDRQAVQEILNDYGIDFIGAASCHGFVPV